MKPRRVLASKANLYIVIKKGFVVFISRLLRYFPNTHTPAYEEAWEKIVAPEKVLRALATITFYSDKFYFSPTTLFSATQHCFQPTTERHRHSKNN